MKQGSSRRQQNDTKRSKAGYPAANQIEFLEELVNGLAANGATDAARHYGGEARVARPDGIEPSTAGLEDRRSIH